GAHPTPATLGPLTYNPFAYHRRESIAVDNIGGGQVPVVIADYSKLKDIQPEDLQHIGYQYNKGLDKWHISDTAADYLFTDCQVLNFTLPGTLKVIVSHTIWAQVPDKTKYFPIMEAGTYLQDEVEKSASLNFIILDNTLSADLKIQLWNKLKKDPTVVLCFSSEQENALQDIRMGFIELLQENIHNPVVLICDSQDETLDPALIH